MYDYYLSGAKPFQFKTPILKNQFFFFLSFFERRQMNWHSISAFDRNRVNKPTGVCLSIYDGISYFFRYPGCVDPFLYIVSFFICQHRNRAGCVKYVSLSKSNNKLNNSPPLVVYVIYKHICYLENVRHGLLSTVQITAWPVVLRAVCVKTWRNSPGRLYLTYLSTRYVCSRKLFTLMLGGDETVSDAVYFIPKKNITKKER